jgi:Fe-S-cluster containining protein
MAGKTGGKWKDDAHRRALLALYAEVDALLAPYGCAASGECCNFANTGREPYPTAVELEEVRHAMRGANVTLLPDRKKKQLKVVPNARVCPMLDHEGRCRIYASRPFGCRTYFCDRMTGPGRLPRPEIQRISRAIADLSARFSPRDPGPRPLLRALASSTEMP